MNPLTDIFFEIVPDTEAYKRLLAWKQDRTTLLSRVQAWAKEHDIGWVPNSCWPRGYEVGGIQPPKGPKPKNWSNAGYADYIRPYLRSKLSKSFSEIHTPLLVGRLIGDHKYEFCAPPQVMTMYTECGLAQLGDKIVAYFQKPFITHLRTMYTLPDGMVEVSGATVLAWSENDE